jgi:hypothetical protein
MMVEKGNTDERANWLKYLFNFGLYPVPCHFLLVVKGDNDVESVVFEIYYYLYYDLCSQEQNRVGPSVS